MVKFSVIRRKNVQAFFMGGGVENHPLPLLDRSDKKYFLQQAMESEKIEPYKFVAAEKRGENKNAVAEP